jgi:GINS complex subunit 2
MAEDESINIVPNVRMDTLHMICGDYGPFRPQIPVTVPLWLGIAMKKRSKCRIQPPDWMSVERLTEVLEMEREAPREFQPLPFHYVEIAKLLLDNAREDFENNYMVQSLLEDIKDVRWDKVEKGLKNLAGRTHAVKLKNLSAMEVNRMRAFTVRALQSFFKHDNDDMMRQTQSTDPDSQSTLTSSDRLPRRALRPR